ncbi:MAG: 50S ribosomal protein L22 [candidate division Zixibacteria bacterium]|nr:50S ribosomal protein L22 [candidate division Zixibacteria bacterium]
MSLQTTAKLRYVSIPPRKMRLVANMVKGLPIEKALNILNFTPRIAAYHLAKTLKSAAANALSLEGTDQLRPEDLFVKNITVDSAPTAKRIRFQSMGRIYRYRKRFCHLTVVLEEKAEVHRERVQEEAKAKAAPKKAAVKKPKKVKDKKKKTEKKAASRKDKAGKTDTRAKKAATKKQKVI